MNGNGKMSSGKPAPKNASALKKVAKKVGSKLSGGTVMENRSELSARQMKGQTRGQYVKAQKKAGKSVAPRYKKVK